MRLKPTYRSVETVISLTLRWVGFVSGGATLLGYFANFFEWGRNGPLQFLTQHLETLFLITLSVTVFLLFVWVSVLHRRFIKGYRDKFTHDLRSDWDFDGLWRIPEKNTLLVTGPPDAGGITKTGAHWENYTLTFSARILKDCIGVIVRAQDLNNYYMFQIRVDRIRPHRRVAIPVVPVAENAPVSLPHESSLSNFR